MANEPFQKILLFLIAPSIGGAHIFQKKKYNQNYVLCSSNFPNKNTCMEDWKKI